jgi:hypothetical protein
MVDLTQILCVFAAAFAGSFLGALAYDRLKRDRAFAVGIEVINDPTKKDQP